MDEFMGVLMDRWTNEWMDGRMGRRIEIWMAGME